MINIENKITTIAHAMGFDQNADVETARFIGALTRLAVPKRVLELGTGLGMTTHHILSNLPKDSIFETVESDVGLYNKAKELFVNYPAVSFLCTDGSEYLNDSSHRGSFDLIFADTWPGKYYLLDEVIACLAPGGLYVIDDMMEQPNWPDGHANKATAVLEHLKSRPDLDFSFFSIGTGIGIGENKGTG